MDIDMDTDTDVLLVPFSWRTLTNTELYAS